METCRRLDIPVRQDLGAILPGLAAGEHSEIGRRTPGRLGCAEPVFCLAIATNHVDGLTLTLNGLHLDPAPLGKSRKNSCRWAVITVRCGLCVANLGSSPTAHGSVTYS